MEWTIPNTRSSSILITNTGTGYQDNQYSSSGADYLIENGMLYKYSGTGGCTEMRSAASTHFNTPSPLRRLLPLPSSTHWRPRRLG